jgi:hypothetical protein
LDCCIAGYGPVAGFSEYGIETSTSKERTRIFCLANQPLSSEKGLFLVNILVVRTAPPKEYRGILKDKTNS